MPTDRLMRRNDAAYRIFLRYALTNILILVLPLVLAAVYYVISFRVIRTDLDTMTVSRLSRSMSGVEKLLDDMDAMTVQLANDYEVNYYLSGSGPFDPIAFYNIKRISEKLSAYILRNELFSHFFLYLDKSRFIVWENGFSAYDGFYGTLFSVDGYDDGEWRNGVLSAPDNAALFPPRTVRMNGQQAESLFYRRNIGYGDYFLGSIVGVIDRKHLEGMLAELPETYGGWVYIRDGNGNVIASTNTHFGATEALDATAAGSDRLRVDRETFRLYRMESSLTGWEYVAVLNETKVLSGVRIIRNIAFILLGAGLLIGLGASALLAFANFRPLDRLFRLVLGDQSKSPGRSKNVYEQVEEAVVLLSDSNRRLQHEVSAAGKITRTYFFQNLLQGNYRTREVFLEDKRRFQIEFSGNPYVVILCRLSPLHAAGESGSFPVLRDAFLEAAGRCTGRHDFLIPLSFDDVAVLKAVGSPDAYRKDAAAWIESVRIGMEEGIRAEFSFGVGMPVPDPFLLIISSNQAATAVSFLRSDNRNPLLFYDEIPNVKDSYYYPLDVEENLMKAVRSSNRDLLDSLIRTIRTENFSTRTLPSADVHNLFVALQGTVLRLLADIPSESDAVRSRLREWLETGRSPASLDEFTDILHGLIEAYNHRKKSHNARLLESLDGYILANYARPDLGLTVIAERFGRSENYLSNFYKEQTGECLSVAIQRVRFERAVRLMRETHETVDRIAVLCGYVNTGSFRRAFKRKTGMSPSEFRTRPVGGTPA